MELVEIRVRGHIAKGWSDWLGGLTITHTQRGETVFSGTVRDQAALRGLLDTIADLGLQLSSVASKREVPSTRCVASTPEGRASDVA